jgi:hypothetical protein
VPGFSVAPAGVAAHAAAQPHYVAKLQPQRVNLDVYLAANLPYAPTGPRRGKAVVERDGTVVRQALQHDNHAIPRRRRTEWQLSK